MWKNAVRNVLGWDWSYLTAFVVVLLLFIGAGYTGWHAVEFAHSNNKTGALVALALTVFWGAIAAALLARCFSARRIHAKMQARVVDQTMRHFLDQLEGLNGNKPDSGSASRRAELVDRIHGLAAKALENADRRS